MTKLDRYIADKVKEKRDQMKLSGEDLSDLMGLKGNFVGNVESRSSRAKYNLNHLNELAKIFHCSMADFLPEKPLADNEAITSYTSKKPKKKKPSK